MCLCLDCVCVCVHVCEYVRVCVVCMCVLHVCMCIHMGVSIIVEMLFQYAFHFM